MTSAVREFRTVARIVTGVGGICRLGPITAGLGRRALLVAGASSARNSGVLDVASASLSAKGVETRVYEGVEAEPSVEVVDAIRIEMVDFAADIVIGIGGGSAMDAAKAAAGLAREDDSTAVFLHENKAARPGVPLVTVPTTSGSGAEVTPNAVISDVTAKVKKSIRNGSFLAVAAVLDPALTLSCPPQLTAHSGMDALVQALEAYVSLNATPLSDAFAFEAFRLLWANLPRAFDDGGDIEARSACAHGSLMAGVALANARLGAVHGMAHPVGVRCGAPHGLVCAVLTPEVVKVNLPFSKDKYARIEVITGGGLEKRLRETNTRLGIYDDFASYTIAREDFSEIARESMPSGSLKANPKAFTEPDVISVLDEVMRRQGNGSS